MSLLRMSLSGAVLILTVVVIRAFALHKLPKRLFLTFWGIAIARLLLPISLPPAFNSFTQANKSVPVLDSVEKRISDFTAEILANQQTESISMATQTVHDSTPKISALFLIWGIGALLFAGYFLVSYLRCRREFKTALPVQNDFTKKWLSDHPLQRTVEVRSLTGISTPLTYGLIHPVILMPKSTDWGNESQLQYMLFHEYVHICRFDAIGKLIVAATICVHWFNPMVWVLYILFHRDIELACDECVVRHYGDENRALYARTLIHMEEQRGATVPFYNYFAKNAIEERIESIMKSSQKPLIAMILAIGLMVALSMNTFAAESMASSIAYRDLSTAATQVEYNAILSAREKIIYSSGPWTTTGAKIVKADGTLVDVPNFYDLFPEDWELPIVEHEQAEVDGSDLPESEGPKLSVFSPSQMGISTWNAPLSTYSASFNSNVYLSVADSTQNTAPFYSFTSDGYDVACYAATLPGDKYNLGFNNEDTGKRIDWIPNLAVGEGILAKNLTSLVRYSFSASVYSDPGYARMVVQAVTN